MTTASSQNPAEYTTMRQAILDEIAQDVPQRFVERIHPLLRLAIPVLLMIGVLSTGDAPTYYAFSIVIIIASTLFGVFSVFWPRFWKIGTTIAVFTLFVRAFFEYGDSVLFHVGPLTVTQEGVDSAIWYIAMLLAVCAPLILLSSILSLKDMAQALETMGASRQASYVVMNSIRLVPELGQRASAVQDAQRSRGIQVDGSRWIRLRALLPTVSPLVLSSLASVEERAIAMEVRGFGVSKDTQLLKPHQKFSVRDALYLLISLLVSTAIALGGRFLW